MRDALLAINKLGNTLWYDVTVNDLQETSHASAKDLTAYNY